MLICGVHVQDGTPVRKRTIDQGVVVYTGGSRECGEPAKLYTYHGRLTARCKQHAKSCLIRTR